MLFGDDGFTSDYLEEHSILSKQNYKSVYIKKKQYKIQTGLSVGREASYLG